MATALPLRPNTNSSSTTASTRRRPSLSSFPSSRRSDSQSTQNERLAHSRNYSSTDHSSPTHSNNSSLSVPAHQAHPAHHAPPLRPGRQTTKARRIKSQYPADSSEKHVEYILVASFDIDRGSIMEHQYPGPVGGDEVMLAELMLPDQTHLRAQDWTIFFLHKDADAEDEARARRRRRRGRKGTEDGQASSGAEDEDDDSEGDAELEPGESEDDDESEEQPADIDGPPLVYVLNLVNTKQDNTVKRGAIVKAMAICTRHSFLHIYKPLLLLALEQYFANPTIDTLAGLYNAVNSMDLSLMPRLNVYERFILQSSSRKDLFLEKFEAMIAQSMANSPTNADVNSLPVLTPSPTLTHGGRSRYGLPRDTHEFESVVHYANVPVPVKIPVALSVETVGDFSLIKLITTFSAPHTASPVPFNPVHAHLTTSGPTTHPMIVLLNALLTQKRIIFLGHNLPSSEVAEAVLAACSLASGGMLRGFTRYAFPYTDLTKIDDLLKVPGFIAGVTNPAFAHKPEWWDVLCDISTGRMKISNRIEAAPITEGSNFFQHSSGISGISAIAAASASLSAGLGGSSNTAAGDATGDAAFMTSVLSAINERHGEEAIRTKFRVWVRKFTRLAASFEDAVYGASALHVFDTPSEPSRKPQFGSSLSVATSSPDLRGPLTPNSFKDGELPAEVLGHGYVWPSGAQKNSELAANATRIEGWRTTRSYYNYVQDLATFYSMRAVKALDLSHLHDMLGKLRLSPEVSGNIYLAICAVVQSDIEISQLLSAIVTGAWDARSGPQGMGQGLFYLAYGLLHPRLEVREAVAELLARVQEHEAGRHFWASLGRYFKIAWERVMSAKEARDGAEDHFG